MITYFRCVLVGILECEFVNRLSFYFCNKIFQTMTKFMTDGWISHVSRGTFWGCVGNNFCVLRNFLLNPRLSRKIIFFSFSRFFSKFRLSENNEKKKELPRILFWLLIFHLFISHIHPSSIFIFMPVKSVFEGLRFDFYKKKIYLPLSPFL